MVGNHIIIASLMLGIVGAGARANRDQVTEAFVPTAAAAVVAPQLPTPGAVKDGHDVDRHADGLFYVHADVNGRRIKFLVDTGASVVVLTAADAQSAGITLSADHYRGNVETVGGSTPMAWATLDRVDLAGHRMNNVRAAVVRNGLGVSLLGQNMLARLNSITIEADRLSLR